MADSWARRYNGTERLYQYKIIVIWETNNLNGTHTRSGNNTVWWHVCYDKEPAKTDENGQLEEDIRPLKEELEGEDFSQTQEDDARQEEPVADPADANKEEVEAEKEREEEASDKQARAAVEKAKKEKLVPGVALANENDLSEEERAQREQERAEAVLRNKRDPSAPFRRPIERLREIEAEDRKHREELDKAVDGMG